MIDKIPQHPIIKDIETMFKGGWKRADKKIKTLLVYIGAVCIVVILFATAVTTSKNALNPIKPDDNIKSQGSTVPSSPMQDKEPVLLGSSDCTTEWTQFNPKNWVGMSSFEISNDVWTINTQKKVKDTVIYYKDLCTGGTVIEYQVTPRLQNYLNINVYLRGLLRWEIGGNDRRSIRLWKNTENCADEIKNAVPIKLDNEYLQKSDEILINQPLYIYLATFYLTNGAIRNELWLNYSSKIMNGERVTTPRGTYYFDFDSSSVCDMTHLQDINSEPYQFGLGIQRSNNINNFDLLPKFSFDKFRIKQFSNID